MLIWLLSDSDSSKHLAFRRMLAEFSAHFPEVKAEFAVKTRSSLWESVFAHLRDSKRNPLADVIEIPHNWTALFAKLGLLSDLSKISDDFNPLACPEFITREFVPGDGGAVFSAPWWMEAPALFYRRSALKAWGVQQGDNGISWEEFVSILEKLSISRRSRSADSYPLWFSGSSGPLGIENVLPRVWSRGGGLFSPDLSRASFNKDETSAGIQDMLALPINGHVRLFSPTLFEGGGYFDERSVFAFSSRDINSAKGAKKEAFNMLPFPGCNASFPVNISNLAIFSGTTVLKEGSSLVKWLLKPERSGNFAAAFLAFPCNKAAFEERMGYRSAVPYSASYRRIFAGANLRPNITVYPTAEMLFERILWNMSLAVARKDYSVDSLTRELIIAQGEADYLLSLY
jgi:multiple sugar transport system substrate-binding protein